MQVPRYWRMKKTLYRLQEMRTNTENTSLLVRDETEATRELHGNSERNREIAKTHAA